MVEEVSELGGSLVELVRIVCFGELLRVGRRLLPGGGLRAKTGGGVSDLSGSWKFLAYEVQGCKAQLILHGTFGSCSY